MQLTLEHHGLELHRSLHVGFVSINIQSALCTSGFLVLRFKQQWIKKAFSIHAWESADAEGRLYALFFATLYQGLEHKWTLVAVGGPGTNSLKIPRHKYS